MTGYINKCNNKNKNKNTITMSLKVKDKQIFKNYNKIWKKIESLMSIDFDSKLVYGDKYIKTKIRTFEDNIITNFHDKKMPEEKVPCKCLSIILLDSVLYAYEMYPQTYLEECKYKQQKQQQKQQQKKNYIDEELKSDCDSNDETESDSDSNDETESDTDTNDQE